MNTGVRRDGNIWQQQFDLIDLISQNWNLILFSGFVPAKTFIMSTLEISHTYELDVKKEDELFLSY